MTVGPIRTIAMLGTHVPRQCGNATFTRDLAESVAAEFSELDCFVLTMNDPAHVTRTRHAFASRRRVRNHRDRAVLRP